MAFSLGVDLPLGGRFDYHAAMSDLRFAAKFVAHCRGDAHAARCAR